MGRRGPGRVKVESGRETWVVVVSRSVEMDLAWCLLVAGVFVLGGEGRLATRGKASVETVTVLPEGYMLVYKDQSLDEEAEQHREEEVNSFLSQQQNYVFIPDNLDVLHSPPPPPSASGRLGEGAGAPQPYGQRPHWSQKSGAMRRPAPNSQRRVGLNFDAALAPRNITLPLVDREVRGDVQEM